MSSRNYSTCKKALSLAKAHTARFQSERGGPRVAHWSSLRGRVCVWRGGGVLLGGGWTGVVCRVVSCRRVVGRARPFFSKYVSGDGAYTDVFS